MKYQYDIFSKIYRFANLYVMYNMTSKRRNDFGVLLLQVQKEKCFIPKLFQF